MRPTEPDMPVPSSSMPEIGDTTNPIDSPTGEEIAENLPVELEPEGTLPQSGELEQIKIDALSDLEQKREEAIGGLPNTLTEEQRKNAVEEINRIYDEKGKSIEEADSAGKVSEALNQAVVDSEEVLAKAGLAPLNETEKPFVVLSFLLALSAILFAVFNLRKRKDGKGSEDNKRFRKYSIFSVVLALAAVIAFLFTTGWHGIVLFNRWTILVAVFTVLTISLSLRKPKEDEPEQSDV